MSAEAPIAGDAAAMRAFNRFYTQKIGVLDATPLGGPFSLTEGRVLYELAHRNAPTASELCRDLALDRGYLSRILSRFEKKGLVERSPSKVDGRQNHVAFTEKGAAKFCEIDRAWQAATENLIAPLPKRDRRSVVSAMGRIRSLLDGEAKAGVAAAARVVLRPPRPGDMGWIVQRHGAVYGAEYGWNNEFEALVAEIVAAFIRNYDPAREHCWIAERDGAPAGCVFLLKETEEVGRLRLLFVDPSARGHGIGRKLVEACIDEARKVGYKKLTLWTNDVLVSARRIYQAAGFHLVKEWPDRKFGKDLVGQDWDLEL
jgi:DNA-binding MarR family transcriptional regulator/N-acetylglutamate synthase-like GNAT family acetyltransferase